MKLAVIESPFAGDFEGNAEYARRAVKDCLKRGEAPYASHLFYPQVLDDLLPAERELGIEAGLAWGAKADLVVVYADRGLSGGMRKGLSVHSMRGTPVEIRWLDVAPMGKMQTFREEVERIVGYRTKVG